MTVPDLTLQSSKRRARQLLYVVVVLLLVATAAVGCLAGKYGTTAPLVIATISISASVGYTYAALRWLSRDL